VRGPVAVLFDRLGPYHVARIGAAAAAYPTVAVEFSADSAEYAWDRVDAAFERHTVVREGLADDLSTGVFAQRLFDVLDKAAPSVVAVPGWAHRGALLALSWAVRTNTPVVMMSESTREDFVRTRWREYTKARIVGLCGASLVGGQRHVAYMRELGMRAEAVFTGYDVVDNDYFATRADAARANADAERARLALPEKFFLASNRFVPKKNLESLLRAYAAYRKQAPSDAAKLVLLGDGPLKSELLQVRASLGLEEHVLLPGFQQYEALPTYYGLATAFVHASTTEQWGLVVNEAMAAGLPVVVSNACGCAPDLVRGGENGASFDPSSVEQLTAAMLAVTRDPEVSRKMGQCSREIIARWAPSRFAEQLGCARDVALSVERRGARSVDRAVLLALTLR
jgi:1,2-diacylglycerol 3-alpha-glucosyltransferase